MSDILIRGMEVPEDGHWGTVSIPFYIHGDGSVSDSKGHIIGSAVHIPPHGRLGDLDALAGQFTPDDLYYPTEEDRRDYDNHSISMRDAREVIEMAPTIIPADQI